MSNLFWASKYLRSEECVFNRTYSLRDDEEILEASPSLAAGFFNDGPYDYEACTILSYLATNVHDNRVLFRRALDLIEDDDETFVWVSVQSDNIHISPNEEEDSDYPYKRMSLTELKRANFSLK
jgi:hypothetical protein